MTTVRYFHSVMIEGRAYKDQRWELFRDLYQMCGSATRTHDVNTTNLCTPRRIQPGAGLWTLKHFLVTTKPMGNGFYHPETILSYLEIDFSLDDNPVLIREPAWRAAKGIDFEARRTFGVRTGVRDDTDLVGSVIAPDPFDMTTPMLIKATIELEKAEE